MAAMASGRRARHWSPTAQPPGTAVVTSHWAIVVLAEVDDARRGMASGEPLEAVALAREVDPGRARVPLHEPVADPEREPAELVAPLERRGCRRRPAAGRRPGRGRRPARGAGRDTRTRTRTRSTRPPSVPPARRRRTGRRYSAASAASRRVVAVAWSVSASNTTGAPEHELDVAAERTREPAPVDDRHPVDPDLDRDHRRAALDRDEPRARHERLHRTAEGQLPLGEQHDAEAAVEPLAQQLQAPAHPALALEREGVRDDRGGRALDRVVVDRVGGGGHREVPADAERQAAEDDRVVQVQAVVGRQEHRPVQSLEVLQAGRPDAVRGAHERLHQQHLEGEAAVRTTGLSGHVHDPTRRRASRFASTSATSSPTVASGGERVVVDEDPELLLDHAQQLDPPERVEVEVRREPVRPGRSRRERARRSPRRSSSPGRPRRIPAGGRGPAATGAPASPARMASRRASTSGLRTLSVWVRGRSGSGHTVVPRMCWWGASRSFAARTTASAAAGSSISSTACTRRFGPGGQRDDGRVPDPLVEPERGLHVLGVDLLAVRERDHVLLAAPEREEAVRH